MNKFDGILYCDMDGVLVDFMSEVEKLGIAMHGGHFGPDGEKKIAETKGFWKNLPKMKDADKLWNYVKPYSPHILTAYARWDEDASKKGKKIWIDKHFPVEQSRFHVVARKDKKLFAINTITGNKNVLIDDYIKNIEEFRKAGGIAIHHVSAKTTIEKLKNLGL